MRSPGQRPVPLLVGYIFEFNSRSDSPPCLTVQSELSARCAAVATLCTVEPIGLLSGPYDRCAELIGKFTVKA